MGSVTNLKENKTLFIMCDCRSEVLVIEYDHEYNMADLAIYQTDAAYKTKMSLWQRLVHCFRFLTWEKPYTDQMCMNNRQLKDLKVFLNSLNLE